MSRPGRFPAAGRRPGWGLGEVVLGFLVAVAVSGIVAGLVLAATGDDDLDDVPMTLYALVQASQWVGLVGVPVLASRIKGDGIVRDFGARMEARDVPTGLLIGVALQLVMVPLVSWPWVELLGRDTEEIERRARDLTDRASGFGLLMLALVVVVGAPLAEELFFRGLALRSLTRLVGPTAALVLSSALFAATHLDLLSFPALFVFGVVMVLLVWRTDRLGLAWWAHIGFNATTITVLVAERL